MAPKGLRYAEHFQRHNKVRSFEAHVAKVHSVAWNADGSRLASGSYDKLVALFALDKCRLTRDGTYKGHTSEVDQLCWHPSDCDLLASASEDKTVRIWDTRTKKSAAVVNTRGENINISWCPDGSTIAVGNKDDIVEFIDSRTHKVIAHERYKVETNEISWNNDASHFFVTTGKGEIIVYSWPELKSVLTIQAHPAGVFCIQFDPTGKHFAVGAQDALVSIWDVENLVCLRTIKRLDYPTRAVGFSCDGQLIASGSEDLSIDIADVSTGQRVWELKIDRGIYTLAWHPKEILLAYACADVGGVRPSDKDTGTLKLFGIKSDGD